MLIGSGNTLQLDDLTDTTTVYAQNFSGVEGIEFQVGPAVHQGNTKYNGNFVNGGLLFEVYEPIILNQLTLFTDTVGSRMIDIFNEDMTFLYQQEVYLDEIENVVDLNVELPPDQYTMTTNSDFNTQQYGVINPYLWRSSQNIVFPYKYQGVMSINTSTFGSDYFYYFYDWKVSTPDMYCGSDLVPATALLDLEVATLEIDPAFEFVLSPNPTTGACVLTLKADGAFDMELRNAEGLLMMAEKNIGLNTSYHSIDLSAYPTGMYLIRIIQGNKFFTKKIVRL
jgi:hypothetical protein